MILRKGRTVLLIPWKCVRLYGLKGIEQLFCCSTTTAWRIKNSEWIKPAISQVGRKIVVDADLALELAHQNTERITYKK